ncbi:MAG: hypothetical protein ABW033_12250 [Acidimicrobiia bacterium]
MKTAPRKFLVALLAGVAALAFAIPAFAQQDGGGGPSAAQATDEHVGAAAESVLILGDTVSGGASSVEAQAAMAQGFSVDVVTSATWATMTGPQFASYRAIVFGDPTCSSSSSMWSAPLANASVWAPAVIGNMIVIGTDPVYHRGSHPGANTLIAKGIAFAAGAPGKTGFYANTSCATTNAADILNVVGGGWVSAAAGCEDTIHIVATNPFLLGLTDADLSNWSCSVHAFFTSWPSSFIPIAIDTDAPPLYTSPDGSAGTPYILGRGEGLSSTNILLAPETQTVNVGGTATLTALVQFGGTPIEGTAVTFTVLSGINAGFSGVALTDAGGIATFTYTNDLPGTDEFEASFVNPNAITEHSNKVVVNWEGEIVLSPRFTG